MDTPVSTATIVARLWPKLSGRGAATAKKVLGQTLRELLEQAGDMERVAIIDAFVQEAKRA